MALIVIDTTEVDKLAAAYYEANRGTDEVPWDVLRTFDRAYFRERMRLFLSALRDDGGDIALFTAAVDARIAAAIDAKLGVEKGLRRLLTEPRQCGATSYTGRCCTLTGCHGNHETWVDGTLIHTWNDREI